MEIKKASLSNVEELSKVAISSFIPAHGHSSPKEDMSRYIQSNFSLENLRLELTDEKNYYALLFDEGKIVGYYKINLNLSTEFHSSKDITYMSRLYILPEYYNLGLGKLLLENAIDFSKLNFQSGMWLKVWIENERAIEFYKKQGFKTIGQSDFIISPTHSNPNYIMFLKF